MKYIDLIQTCTTQMEKKVFLNTDLTKKLRDSEILASFFLAYLFMIDFDKKNKKKSMNANIMKTQKYDLRCH